MTVEVLLTNLKIHILAFTSRHHLCTFTLVHQPLQTALTVILMYIYFSVYV